MSNFKCEPVLDIGDLPKRYRADSTSCEFWNMPLLEDCSLIVLEAIYTLSARNPAAFTEKKPSLFNLNSEGVRFKHMTTQNQ